MQYKEKNNKPEKNKSHEPQQILQQHNQHQPDVSRERRKR
jgi:hypothetical protein